MKFITLRKLFQYYIPATLTLFMLVTVERNVEGDIGLYEKIYGLPLSFISSNYAFTHHFDVYIPKMLIDILFYFVGTLLIIKGLELTGLKLKTHWTFVAVGILIILFWIFVFYTITFESSFKLINDFDFKVKSNQLHFGTYPW